MENQKIALPLRKLKVTLSILMPFVLAFLVFYTKNFLLSEFYKSLIIVALLNLFRVLVNTNMNSTNNNQ